MKVLIIGSNSILSSAIFHQHESDEVYVMYHAKPSEQSVNQIPLSQMSSLTDTYEWIYIVSAIISDDPKNSLDLFKVNVGLVATISRQFPSAKLIYFSTVAIYDGLNSIVIDQNTHPSPESIYGISKLWAEKIVLQHSRYSILRISSMYGFGMKSNTFLPRIIADALSKKQITLLGSGSRKQNYISANDVAVLAKKLALMNENKVQLAVSEINYSNAEVAEIIQKETDCSISYTGRDSSRSVEYNQITFPYSEYNRTSLENGIKALIEWKRRLY